MVGLSIVCLTRDGNIWFRFAIMGFGISLATAGTLFVTMELALRTFGRGGIFQLVLWGELTFLAGLLTLLLNHWIAPILESSPRMMVTIRNLGGYPKTGDLVPTLCLSAGAVLLGIAVVRLLKRTGETSKRV